MLDPMWPFAWVTMGEMGAEDYEDPRTALLLDLVVSQGRRGDEPAHQEHSNGRE